MAGVNFRSSSDSKASGFDAEIPCDDEPMTKIHAETLGRAVDDLPYQFRGPGGAIGVVKNGEIIVRHAFGYADLQAHVPFAPTTRAPICSLTKQFTCAALLDAFPDPSELDGDVAARLPLLDVKCPTTRDLCANQSGLRDYWALTVLCGARPEGPIRPEQARQLLGLSRRLQFSPGAQYSYSNGNFRILSEILEDRLQHSFGEILQERIFDRVGMSTATFEPETSAMSGDAIGYEGNLSFGFIPAVNKIHWSGDAGVVATLDDMLAWEQFIDATRDDDDSLYQQLSRTQTFSDGHAAPYGFGLSHSESQGVKLTGHGGALRGWRCHRLHAASERLSVVVVFNHHADAQDAALHLVRAALGQTTPAPPKASLGSEWAGRYLDSEAGLVLEVTTTSGGRLSARYSTGADILSAGPDGQASSRAMTLRREGSDLAMERPRDNIRAVLKRLEGPAEIDFEGVYQSAELGAAASITSAGGMMHIAFDGLLGSGPIFALMPVAPDIWLMPCQRAMDAPAPGDWTVLFKRDSVGTVASFTIGCWLARHVVFEKVGRA